MNYFKQFNKILSNQLQLNSKSNLFRNLTNIEKYAVEVYDYRDISEGDPNNNVIITCEHATNKTHKYVFPKNDKKWLDSHWGYDPGAKEMGIELSEDAKIFSMYSNFSRLIIDPNRSLLSKTLIRKHVEQGVELQINKSDVLDEDRRIDLYYMPYYKILKEALKFTQPKYAICSHSFTKQYENNEERNYEVGILFREKGLLADMIESVYKKEGVNYRINEPYHPKEGVCHVMDSIYNYNWPEFFTDVVLLEFRNDYCTDSKWRKKQVKMLSPIIQTLKKM